LNLVRKSPPTNHRSDSWVNSNQVRGLGPSEKIKKTRIRLAFELTRVNSS